MITCCKSSGVIGRSQSSVYCATIKYCCSIEAIWATKQTEETEGDQELKIKTTLRELVIYCAFLLVLCIS